MTCVCCVVLSEVVVECSFWLSVRVSNSMKFFESLPVYLKFCFLDCFDSFSKVALCCFLLLHCCLGMGS